MLCTLLVGHLSKRIEEKYGQTLVLEENNKTKYQFNRAIQLAIKWRVKTSNAKNYKEKKNTTATVGRNKSTFVVWTAIRPIVSGDFRSKCPTRKNECSKCLNAC